MTDGQRLAKAISFAATKHADQTRKDGTPYIYHPMAVAELLKNVNMVLTCRLQQYSMMYLKIQTQQKKR